MNIFMIEKKWVLYINIISYNVPLIMTSIWNIINLIVTLAQNIKDIFLTAGLHLKDGVLELLLEIGHYLNYIDTHGLILKLTTNALISFILHIVEK